MLCVSSRDRLWAAACSEAGPVVGWPPLVWLATASPVAACTGDAAEAGAVLPVTECGPGERTRISAATAPAATALRTMAVITINCGRPSRGGPPGPPGPPRPGRPGGWYGGGKPGGWTRSASPHL